MTIDQVETSEGATKGLLFTEAAVEKVLEVRLEEDEPEKLGLRVQIRERVIFGLASVKDR